MDTLFNVCFSNLGIVVYDMSDDSMTKIQSSRDSSLWGKFDYATAREISRNTGWKPIKIESVVDDNR